MTLLFATLLSSCSSSDGDNTVRTEVQATLQETLDTALEANIALQEPGLAMVIIKDGVVRYERSIGMADIPAGISIEADSGFRLASVSKTFTALAIMQLYERGLLQLEDSLSLYVQNIPEQWSSITVHHLLTHQSGILDVLNDLNDDQIKEIFSGEILRDNTINYLIENTKLEFIPGSTADYSNSGYVFLAEIVSQISGISYAEFIQQNILTPLDMQDSYVIDETTTLAAGDALNHGISFRFFDPQIRISLIGAAGVVSSLKDMQKFLDGISNNALVTEGTLNTMRTGYNRDFPGSIDYGYGLFLGGEGPGYFHLGGLDGFNNLYWVNPNSGVSIVILGNGGDELPDYNFLINLASSFL